jgi:hypothetical protein
MTLTEDQQAFLPTDSDVAFYREHGWYVTKKILPPELMDEAWAGVERHFKGERDAPLPVSSGYSDWKPGDGDGIRNCEYVTLQNRQIRRLTAYPLLGAIAARLAGTPAVRLFDDQLIYKPPQAGGTRAVVGWHSDRAYWMTCSSENMLTAWIPFHDCPLEMGPLMVIDGSHRWPNAASIRKFNEQDLSAVERQVGAGPLPFKKVPILLERGQVSFHHCLAVHGSDENATTRPRVSLAVHLQDDENRYREYRNEQGVPWRLVNDRLCRRTIEGTPDYTDPSAFPEIWSDR